MNKEDLFISRRNILEANLEFLPDKPEETPDSTLRALWLTASGNPRSVVEAVKLPLPGLTYEQLKLLDQLIEKRLRKIPLAYITGRQSYMGIEFLSDSRALIPRKETELLGRKALDISLQLSAINGNLNIIDLCCGSGNIGLSLAMNNQKCIIYAGDICGEALDLANDNVERLGLTDRIIVRQGDMFDALIDQGLEKRVDIIVCNPPYISSSKVTDMHDEISAHEPHHAFDGGMLGLSLVRRLINESPLFLRPGLGWLLFEVGAGQGDMISEICRRSGHYNNINAIRDSDNIIRVITLQSKDGLSLTQKYF